MPRVRRPPVAVDLRPYFRARERGHHFKDMIVLHETVSYNQPGLADIRSVAAYMASRGLEIHGIIDKDGNTGWCEDPTAVYDHTASRGGNVNSRSIGFELVSEVPLLRTNALRFATWWSRREQLDTVARWIAWLHESEGIPVRASDGSKPGVTTHWHVSRTFAVPGGHWDGWPKALGGYFPFHYVIRRARSYLERGW